MKKENGLTRFNTFLKKILLGICAGVFFVCVFTAAGEIYPYVREQQIYAQLADRVEKAGQKAGDTSQKGQLPGSVWDSQKATPASHMQPLLRYAQLYRENPDLAGWLRIEGTRIDYPVMYTPEDPEYYLHRNFYGDQAYGGCLFMGEGYCREGGNTIIYGHHMKDGSMFAGLLAYASQEFADAHPLIHFDTIYEEGIYQAFAAFYCDLDEEGTDAFLYYAYPDLSDEDVFYDYISRISKKNIIDTGQEIGFGDQLITLSTCRYHLKNGRFVVAAKKVETAWE